MSTKSIEYVINPVINDITGLDNFTTNMNKVAETVQTVSGAINDVSHSLADAVHNGNTEVGTLLTQAHTFSAEVDDLQKDMNRFAETANKRATAYQKMDAADPLREKYREETNAWAASESTRLRNRAASAVAAADIFGIGGNVSADARKVFGNLGSGLEGIFSFSEAQKAYAEMDKAVAAQIRKVMPQFTAMFGSMIAPKGALADLSNQIGWSFGGQAQNAESNVMSAFNQMAKRLISGDAKTGAALLPANMLKALTGGASGDAAEKQLAKIVRDTYLAQKGYSSNSAFFAQRFLFGDLGSGASRNTAQDILANSGLSGLFATGKDSKTGAGTSFALNDMLKAKQGQLNNAGREALVKALRGNAMLTRAAINSGVVTRSSGMDLELGATDTTSLQRLAQQIALETITRVNGQNPSNKIVETLRTGAGEQLNEIGFNPKQVALANAIANSTLTASKTTNSFKTAKRATSRLSTGSLADTVAASNLVRDIVADDRYFTPDLAAQVAPARYTLKDGTRYKRDQYMIEQIMPFMDPAEFAKSREKRTNYQIKMWDQGIGANYISDANNEVLLTRAQYVAAKQAADAKLASLSGTSEEVEAAYNESSEAKLLAKYRKMISDRVAEQTGGYHESKLIKVSTGEKGKTRASLARWNALDESPITRMLGLGHLDHNEKTDILKEISLAGFTGSQEDYDRLDSILGQVGVAKQALTSGAPIDIDKKGVKYVLHAQHGQGGPASSTLRLIRKAEYEKVEKNWREQIARPMELAFGLPKGSIGSIWNDGLRYTTAGEDGKFNYTKFAKEDENRNKMWTPGVDLAGAAINMLDMKDASGNPVSFPSLIRRIMKNEDGTAFELGSKALGAGGKLPRMALVDFSTIAKRAGKADVFRFDNANEGQSYIIDDFARNGAFQSRAGLSGKGTISSISDMAKSMAEMGLGTVTANDDGTTTYRAMLPSGYGQDFEVYSTFKDGKRISGNYEGFVDVSYQKNKDLAKQVYDTNIKAGVSPERAMKKANMALSFMHSLQYASSIADYKDDGEGKGIGVQASQFISLSPAMMQHQAKAFEAFQNELKGPEGIYRHIYSGVDESDPVASLLRTNGAAAMQQYHTEIDKKVNDFLSKRRQEMAAGAIFNFSAKDESISTLGNTAFNVDDSGSHQFASAKNVRVVTNPFMAFLGANGVDGRGITKKAWAKYLDDGADKAAENWAAINGDKANPLNGITEDQFNRTLKLLGTSKDSLQKAMGKDFVNNEQFMGLLTLTGHGKVGDKDYIAPGFLNFDNPEAMVSAFIRSPNGFAQMVGGVNYARLFNGIFGDNNIQKQGVFFNMRDMEAMAGADWDGDMIKSITSGKYSLDSINKFIKNNGGNLNVKNNKDLMDWLGSTDAYGYAAMRANGSAGGKDGSIVDDVLNTLDAIKELNLFNVTEEDEANGIASMYSKSYNEAEKRMKIQATNMYDSKSYIDMFRTKAGHFGAILASRQMGKDSAISSRLSSLNLIDPRYRKYAEMALIGNGAYDAGTTILKKPLTMVSTADQLAILGLGAEWGKILHLADNAGGAYQFKSTDGEFTDQQGLPIKASDIVNFGDDKYMVMNNMSFLRKSGKGYMLDTMQNPSVYNKGMLSILMSEIQGNLSGNNSNELVDYFVGGISAKPEWDEKTYERTNGGMDYLAFNYNKDDGKEEAFKYTRMYMDNARRIKAQRLGMKHMALTPEERRVQAMYMALSSREIEQYVDKVFADNGGSTIKIKNDYYDPQGDKNDPDNVPEKELDRGGYIGYLRNMAGLNAGQLEYGSKFIKVGLTSDHLSTGITPSSILAQIADMKDPKQRAVYTNSLLRPLLAMNRPTLDLAHTELPEEALTLAGIAPKYIANDPYGERIEKNARLLGLTDEEIAKIKGVSLSEMADNGLVSIEGRAHKPGITATITAKEEEPEEETPEVVNWRLTDKDYNGSRDFTKYVGFRRAAERMLDGAKMVAWDTETTGTKVDKDNILQLAAARFGLNGVSKDEGSFMDALITPTEEMFKAGWEEAAKVTEITPEYMREHMEAGATVSMKEAANIFHDIAKGAITVGFNQHAYDQPIFTQNIANRIEGITTEDMDRLAFAPGPENSIDVLELWRTLSKDNKEVTYNGKTQKLSEFLNTDREQVIDEEGNINLKGRHTLENIVRHFGVNTENAHDASYDSMFTAAGLFKGLELMYSNLGLEEPSKQFGKAFDAVSAQVSLNQMDKLSVDTGDDISRENIKTLETFLLTGKGEAEQLAKAMIDLKAAVPSNKLDLSNVYKFLEQSGLEIKKLGQETEEVAEGTKVIEHNGNKYAINATEFEKKKAENERAEEIKKAVEAVEHEENYKAAAKQTAAQQREIEDKIEEERINRMVGGAKPATPATQATAKGARRKKQREVAEAAAPLSTGGPGINIDFDASGMAMEVSDAVARAQYLHDHNQNINKIRSKVGKYSQLNSNPYETSLGHAEYSMGMDFDTVAREVKEFRKTKARYDEFNPALKEDLEFQRWQSYIEGATVNGVKGPGIVDSFITGISNKLGVDIDKSNQAVDSIYGYGKGSADINKLVDLDKLEAEREGEIRGAKHKFSMAFDEKYREDHKAKDAEGYVLYSELHLEDEADSAKRDEAEAKIKDAEAAFQQLKEKLSAARSSIIDRVVTQLRKDGEDITKLIEGGGFKSESEQMGDSLEDRVNAAIKLANQKKAAINTIKESEDYKNDVNGIQAKIAKEEEGLNELIADLVNPNSDVRKKLAESNYVDFSIKNNKYSNLPGFTSKELASLERSKELLETENHSALYADRTIQSHNMQTYWGNSTIGNLLKSNINYVNSLKMNETRLAADQLKATAAYASATTRGAKGFIDIEKEADPEKRAEMQKRLDTLRNHRDRADLALERNRREQDNWSGIGGILRGFGGMAISSVITKISKGFKQLIAEAKKFVNDWDAAMGQIEAKSGLSGEALDNLGDKILKTATSLKVSAPELAKNYASLFAAGFDSSKIDEAAVALTKFSTITGQKMNKSIKQLALLLNTDLVDSIDQAMDKLTALSDKSAASADDITKVLQKMVGVSTNMGMSSNESMALATFAAESLGGSASVASDLGLILTRISGVKEASSTAADTIEIDGANYDVGSIRSLERTLGMSILGDDGSMTSSFEVLSQLASRWQTMSDIERQALGSVYGGSTGRQTNTFMSLMNAWSVDPEKMQTYMDALENSDGIVDRQYEAMTDTVAASRQRMLTSWNGFINEITGGSDGWFVNLQQDFYDTIANIFTGSEKLNENKVLSEMYRNQADYLNNRISDISGMIESGNTDEATEALEDLSKVFPDISKNVEEALGEVNGFNEALAILKDRRDDLYKDSLKEQISAGEYSSIKPEIYTNDIFGSTAFGALSDFYHKNDVKDAARSLGAYDYSNYRDVKSLYTSDLVSFDVNPNPSEEDYNLGMEQYIIEAVRRARGNERLSNAQKEVLDVFLGILEENKDNPNIVGLFGSGYVTRAEGQMAANNKFADDILSEAGISIGNNGITKVVYDAMKAKLLETYNPNTTNETDLDSWVYDSVLGGDFARYWDFASQTFDSTAYSYDKGLVEKPKIKVNGEDIEYTGDFNDLVSYVISAYNNVPEDYSTNSSSDSTHGAGPRPAPGPGTSLEGMKYEDILKLNDSIAQYKSEGFTLDYILRDKYNVPAIADYIATTPKKAVNTDLGKQLLESLTNNGLDEFLQTVTNENGELWKNVSNLANQDRAKSLLSLLDGYKNENAIVTEAQVVDAIYSYLIGATPEQIAQTITETGNKAIQINEQIDSLTGGSTKYYQNVADYFGKSKFDVTQEDVDKYVGNMQAQYGLYNSAIEANYRAISGVFGGTYEDALAVISNPESTDAARQEAYNYINAYNAYNRSKNDNVVYDNNLKSLGYISNAEGRGYLRDVVNAGSNWTSVVDSWGSLKEERTSYLSSNKDLVEYLALLDKGNRRSNEENTRMAELKVKLDFQINEGDNAVHFLENISTLLTDIEAGGYRAAKATSSVFSSIANAGQDYAFAQSISGRNFADLSKFEQDTLMQKTGASYEQLLNNPAFMTNWINSTNTAYGVAREDAEKLAKEKYGIKWYSHNKQWKENALAEFGYVANPTYYGDASNAWNYTGNEKYFSRDQIAAAARSMAAGNKDVDNELAKAALSAIGGLRELTVGEDATYATQVEEAIKQYENSTDQMSYKYDVMRSYAGSTNIWDKQAGLNNFVSKSRQQNEAFGFITKDGILDLASTWDGLTPEQKQLVASALGMSVEEVGANKARAQSTAENAAKETKANIDEMEQALQDAARKSENSTMPIELFAKKVASGDIETGVDGLKDLAQAYIDAGGAADTAGQKMADAWEAAQQNSKNAKDIQTILSSIDGKTFTSVDELKDSLTSIEGIDYSDLSGQLSNIMQVLADAATYGWDLDTALQHLSELKTFHMGATEEEIAQANTELLAYFNSDMTGFAEGQNFDTAAAKWKELTEGQRQALSTRYGYDKIFAGGFTNDMFKNASDYLMVNGVGVKLADYVAATNANYQRSLGPQKGYTTAEVDKALADYMSYFKTDMSGFSVGNNWDTLNTWIAMRDSALWEEVKKRNSAIGQFDGNFSGTDAYGGLTFAQAFAKGTKDYADATSLELWGSYTGYSKFVEDRRNTAAAIKNGTGTERLDALNGLVNEYSDYLYLSGLIGKGAGALGSDERKYIEGIVGTTDPAEYLAERAAEWAEFETEYNANGVGNFEEIRAAASAAKTQAQKREEDARYAADQQRKVDEWYNALTTNNGITSFEGLYNYIGGDIESNGWMKGTSIESLYNTLAEGAPDGYYGAVGYAQWLEDNAKNWSYKNRRYGADTYKFSVDDLSNIYGELTSGTFNRDLYTSQYLGDLTSAFTSIGMTTDIGRLINPDESAGFTSDAERAEFMYKNNLAMNTAKLQNLGLFNKEAIDAYSAMYSAAYNPNADVNAWSALKMSNIDAAQKYNKNVEILAAYNNNTNEESRNQNLLDSMGLEEGTSIEDALDTLEKEIAAYQKLRSAMSMMRTLGFITDEQYEQGGLGNIDTGTGWINYSNGVHAAALNENLQRGAELNILDTMESGLGESGAGEQLTQLINSNPIYQQAIENNKDLAKAVSEYTRAGGNASKATADLSKKIKKSNSEIVDSYKSFNTAFSHLANLNYYLNKDSWTADEKKEVGDLLGIKEDDIDNFGEDYMRHMLEAMRNADVDTLQSDVNDLVSESFHMDPTTNSISIGDIELTAGETKTVGIDAFIAQAEQMGNDALVDLLNRLKEQYAVADITASLDETGHFAAGFDGSVLSSGKGRRVSSGGGGGKSAVDKLLEKWKRKVDADKHHITMVKSQEEKYQERGELANYGNMLETENMEQEKLKATTLEAIDAFREQLKHVENGSDDYYKLVDAIYSYEESVEDINNTIYKNTKAIKENREAMRKSRTEVEKMLEDALKSIDDYKDSMLDGLVDMQNLILDTLKDSYQKQWDYLKEDLERKKEALAEEKEMISERLQARKDAEDAANKYADLEAQQNIARYLALDSSRSGEYLDMMRNIQEAQRDLGWDEAQNLADAEAQNIQDQIDTIDRYVMDEDERVANFLEDSRNFADQVNDILKMSSEDLLAWLGANVDEYGKMMDAAQEQQLRNWEDMWMKMEGKVKLYWDEIYSTIEEGSEAIVNVITQTQDYINASDTEKLSIIYETMEKIDAYTSAYKGTTISQNYDEYLDTIADAISAGDLELAGKYLNGYAELMTGSADYHHSDAWETNRSCKEIEGCTAHISENTDILVSVLRDADLLSSLLDSDLDVRGLTRYASGGLVTKTGPAWLDGTPGLPEYVLNNESFENLKGILNTAMKLSFIPYMSSVGSDAFGSNNTIGDVTVNINEASISSDYDVERLAERVGETFVRQLETNGYRRY